MSRKLSLVGVALTALLLAVPAVAQQPAKDSTKAAATTTKHKSKHHKGGAMAKPAAKDSTKGKM
jgi:hypothetical protein